MMRSIEAIVGDRTPRVVNSPGAEAGRARIVALFAEAGVALEAQSIHLVRSRAGELSLTNLVGRIPGTDPAAGAIAVVSHSDSVPGSPGAGDAASGVAAVLEVAYALRDAPPRHDVVVLITDGEEAGLLGADVFMTQHPWAPELKGVLNIDARGAAGPAFVFELGPDTIDLVGRMRQHVAAPRTTSLAAWVYDRMPNGTDFMVFRKGGLTGYNLAFIGDFAAYHTPQDAPERLNPSTIHHYGHAALGLIRALDDMPGNAVAAAAVTTPETGLSKPLLALAPERAAWSDIAGVFIVSWPESIGPLLACLATVLVLAQAFGRAARNVGAVRAIGYMVGAAVVCLVAAALLGWGAQAGAKAMAVSMRSAPERTTALNVLLWASAAALLVGAAVVVSRRAASSAATAFAAVWTVWSVAACASAFLLPAFAPLLVLPVFAAGLGALVASRSSVRIMVIAGSLAGLAASVLVWVPLEPAFLDALGMSLAPATGARAALVMLPAVPLVLLASRRVGARTSSAGG